MRLDMNRLCGFVFRFHNGETQIASYTSNGLRSYGVRRVDRQAAKGFFTLIAVNRTLIGR